MAWVDDFDRADLGALAPNGEPYEGKNFDEWFIDTPGAVRVPANDDYANALVFDVFNPNVVVTAVTNDAGGIYHGVVVRYVDEGNWLRFVTWSSDDVNVRVEVSVGGFVTTLDTINDVVVEHLRVVAIGDHFAFYTQPASLPVSEFDYPGLGGTRHGLMSDSSGFAEFYELSVDEDVPPAIVAPLELEAELDAFIALAFGEIDAPLELEAMLDAEVPAVFANYNPSAPCVLGMEWLPAARRTAWIESVNNALAFSLVASEEDEIDQLSFMVACWAGDQSVAIELFGSPEEAESMAALTWQTFRPSGDRYYAPDPWRPGTWGVPSGFAPGVQGPPFWNYLDSVTMTPATWVSGQIVDNDRALYTYAGDGFDVAVSCAGVIGSMVGRRVTRVRVQATVAQELFFGDRSGGLQVTPYLWINGRKFYGTSSTVRAAKGPTEVVFDWSLNPFSGKPWTVADVDIFDTDAIGPNTAGIGFRMSPTGTLTNGGLILKASLQVESMVENRLAIGGRKEPAGSQDLRGPCHQAWMPWDLYDPETGTSSTVTLNSEQRYVVVMRKATLSQNTSFGVSTVYQPGSSKAMTDTLADFGPPHWTEYTGPRKASTDTMGQGVRVDAGSRRVLDLGMENGFAPGVALRKVGGAMSKDSQPYAFASNTRGKTDDWPDLAEWFDNSSIYGGAGGRWMEQEFTAVADDDYGRITLMVAQIAATSDGALEIDVRRRFDDALIAQVEITTDDLAAPRTAYQRVSVELSPPAPLELGVQYYFRIRSSATAGQGWLVGAANSGYEPEITGPPAGTNAVAGFGAGVDLLTFGDKLMNRFGFTAPDDPGSVVALINISTVPEGPEELTAVPSGLECCIESIAVAWSNTAMVCGTHVATEVQRNDDGVWRTIAYITNAEATTFTDWEFRTGQLIDYRVRAVRGDGAASEWATLDDPVQAAIGCTGLVFTSNESPDLTVFYGDVVDQREFTFPNYDEIVQAHDRDFHIAFRQLENPGTVFTTKLNIRDGRLPCGPGCGDPTGFGDDVFWPVRQIARAGLSYVCVKNEAGNRWYAYVAVTAGRWKQHGQEASGGWAYYEADASITQVGNVPSQPDQGVEP